MDTHLLFKGDDLTAEDILQLPQTPKYIKISQMNEQVNGLKKGDVLKIISVFSKPCIRCKFLFKDGSIRHILEREEINIPLCYPDYVLLFQSDRQLINVESCDLLGDFVNKHLCPQYVKLLNWKLAQEIFEDDMHDIFTEIEFAFDQHLLICEKHQTFDYADTSSVLAQWVFPTSFDYADTSSVPAQWVFPTLYVDDSRYKMKFLISEEYTNDLQASNQFAGADVKTAVEMVNTITKYKKAESFRSMFIPGTITKLHKNLPTSQSCVGLNLTRDGVGYVKQPIKTSRSSPAYGARSHSSKKRHEWSTKKYSLLQIINEKQAPPMYLKICNDNRKRVPSAKINRVDTDHEFLLNANDICNVIDIQKGKCIMATQFKELSQAETGEFNDSPKSVFVNTNIPISYPYLILDKSNAFADTSRSCDVHWRLKHTNSYNYNIEALVSLKSLFDNSDGRSKNSIRIIEKVNNKNSIFRYLKNVSHEINLEDKPFDQYYMTLSVLRGKVETLVMVPCRYVRSKYQFFISNQKNSAIDVDKPTMQFDEAFMTAASNFPIAFPQDGQNESELLGQSLCHAYSEFSLDKL